MRSFARRLFAAFVFAVLVMTSLPVVAAEEDKFPISTLKSVGSSAASHGAIIAAKAIANAYYSGSCTGKTLDTAHSYVCGLVGSFTGQDEKVFREEVKSQLTAISSQLKSISEGQERLGRSLDKADETAYKRFKQAAAENHATDIFVDIRTLWSQFEEVTKPLAVISEDIKRTRAEETVNLAKEIREGKLDARLDRLNTLMTQSVLGNQPLLRYEFVEKRGKNDPDGALDVYDSVEKTYAEVLMDEQRAYLMVLWADQVAQAECSSEAQCKSIESHARGFQAKFESHTRQQAEAFNKAVDWYLLSFDLTHGASPLVLPPGGTDIVRRANYMTSSILTADEKAPEAQGLWGRVYAMGPGAVKIRVTCGGQQKVLDPVLEYTVPVHDPSRSLDWWTSSAGDNVYDEVRFARDWRVLHYRWAGAPQGPCTVDTVLPGEPRRSLPWTDPAAGVTQVANTQVDNTPVEKRVQRNFGSFLAVQRAGGTYALMTGGNWLRQRDAYQEEKGSAKIADHRFEWRIEADRFVPWISLISEGFGRYVVLSGSTVDNKTQIHLLSRKKIRFPEGTPVKLHYKQDPDCLAVCRDGKNQDNMVLEYNVDNSDAKNESGYLNGAAAIFFSPKPHFVEKGFDAEMQWPTGASEAGLWVEGSFASRRNEHGLRENPPAGSFAPKASESYYLNYLITFSMKTTGKGIDSTHWMYRAKLSPKMVYLSQ